MIKAALFVPCYVDAFFPEVGIATLELLERLGVEVDYPLNQTCCGQPMANSGCHDDAAATEVLFVQNFSGYDYIVTPSGSCAHHVREHLTAIPQSDETLKVRASTFELVEFLHDILKVREFPWAKFPHAVGLHNGCASLRALRTAKMSEIDEPFFSKPLELLSKVKGAVLRKPHPGTQPHPRPGRGEHRHAEPPRQPAGAASVVAVLVGEDDGAHAA